MSYDPQQAFDAIQSLETTGKLPGAPAAETINIGTFNVQTRQFEYAVPEQYIKWSFYVSSTHGYSPRQNLMGIVAGYAANLKLTFSVSHGSGTFTVQIAGQTDSIQTQPVMKQNLQPHFPTPNPIYGDTVTVNLGAYASTAPPFNQEPGTAVNMICGGVGISIHLFIMRLPLYAAGVFSIPAMPVAIIYAPPSDAESKSYAEYTATTTISNKISTSFSSGNSTKPADAYSDGDFSDKIGGVISAINGLLGTFAEKHADIKALGPYAAGISLGMNLLSGVLSQTVTSSSNLVVDGTEHDLTTTNINSTSFGTPPGLGPGLGDRFVYLRDVKIAYLIDNGTMSYTVLGYAGIRAFAAEQLIADIADINASPGTVLVGPTTGLDELTLQSLLILDPFVINPEATTLPSPRFVMNDPQSIGGGLTDVNGDNLTATHEVTTVDIATTTTTNTTTTDKKPGWILALFGNTANETQMILTYGSSSQITVDSVRTATVHFFNDDAVHPYIVGLQYDRLFGTIAFTPSTI